MWVFSLKRFSSCCWLSFIIIFLKFVESLFVIFFLMLYIFESIWKHIIYGKPVTSNERSCTTGNDSVESFQSASLHTLTTFFTKHPIPENVAFFPLFCCFFFIFCFCFEIIKGVKNLSLALRVYLRMCFFSIHFERVCANCIHTTSLVVLFSF